MCSLPAFTKLQSVRRCTRSSGGNWEGFVGLASWIEFLLIAGEICLHVSLFTISVIWTKEIRVTSKRKFRCQVVTANIGNYSALKLGLSVLLDLSNEKILRLKTWSRYIQRAPLFKFYVILTSLVSLTDDKETRTKMTGLLRFQRSCPALLWEMHAINISLAEKYLYQKYGQALDRPPTQSCLGESYFTCWHSKLQTQINSRTVRHAGRQTERQTDRHTCSFRISLGETGLQVLRQPVPIEHKQLQFLLLLQCTNDLLELQNLWCKEVIGRKRLAWVFDSRKHRSWD